MIYPCMLYSLFEYCKTPKISPCISYFIFYPEYKPPPENKSMDLYSENPAIAVKRKQKLTNTDVLYHNVFGVLRYVSKKTHKNYYK